MNRKSVRFICLVTVLFGLSAGAWAQKAQDFNKVQIKTTDLDYGLYMLEGAGGNLGLSVGDDGVFLIDDQFAPLADKIKAAIGKVTNQPVDYLINTHWHGDHVGGNEHFAKSGTLIFAHSNVRDRMSSVQKTRLSEDEVPPSPARALPVVTFSNDINFHINGLNILGIHAERAHTDGDVIVQFRGANVIHMGDLFFNGAFPFIDIDSGGTLKGLIKACELAMARMNRHTKVIPGHGPLATRADFRSYINMLKRVRKLIDSHVKRGDSKQETLDANPLKKLDEDWGGGFINTATFTELTYDAIKEGG